MRVRLLVPLAASALLFAAISPACRDEDAPERLESGETRNGDPPTAQRELLDALRRSHAAPRHAADARGSAWLELAEGERASHVAGSRARFSIVFEASPEGVAIGGSIRFRPSPWWRWSEPQTQSTAMPGFTAVESLVSGVELDVAGRDWIVATVRGRALGPGERVRFVYGAGEGAARVDTYAEHESRLWLAVDGDGDGFAHVIPDSPVVEIRAGPVAQLALVAPSTARIDAAFALHVSLLDAFGNAGSDFVGEVALVATPASLELPASVSFAAEHAGNRTIVCTARAAGVHRVAAAVRIEDESGERGLSATSNPLLVEASPARILWGDLHGHSGLSDGTGTPQDYYRYARDVAGLDVAVLTDHDHWGMLPLDEHPELWSSIEETAQRFHAPGSFVTLLGYEWTNWIHGHRHVLYFADSGRVLSSIDERYETPAQLWDALRGEPALTFAHHSAGGPVATNWDFAPDPLLEPVTEIVSVHGASEALDAPSVIYSALPGNFVRDALGRGYRLGFVGSGDSHDGHPGLAHLGAASGGIAAILSDELTREGVRAALLARRSYATNGSRIVLRAVLDSQRMGSLMSVPSGGSATLYVRAIGCAAIDRIEVVRGMDVVITSRVGGSWDVETTLVLEDLRAGEFVYLRVVQEDGATAWSSPFFLE